MLEKAIKATTQQHLDIHTVKDHLIILKDGSVALVLQTSAINFGLLSEEEQDATIYGYAALLNSLSFTVQIIIRSSRKDISDYVQRLDDQLENTRSQKIREQIVKYRTYIKSLVKENKVMEKKFFCVIPYSTVELGLSANSFNPLAKAPQKPAYEDDFILEKARITLYPRRDHLIRQFARLGLLTKQLTTQELVTLFYRVYNPNSQTPPFLANPQDFETTAVQANNPIPTPTAAVASTPPPLPPNVVFQAPGKKETIAPPQNPPSQTPGPITPTITPPIASQTVTSSSSSTPPSTPPFQATMPTSTIPPTPISSTVPAQPHF